MSTARKLIIMGGSFNPPHLGHLDVVRELLKQPHVSRVMVVPSFGTPLKLVDTSFDDRYEMSKINFDSLNEKNLIVSDIEKTEKINYTWQLLGCLPKTESNTFVIGTDQFNSLKKWARFPDFLGQCDWLVLLRKPTTLESIQEQIKNYCADGVLIPTTHPYEFKIKIGGQNKSLNFVETNARQVSSTEIRTLFARGLKNEVKNYLNKEVQDYIERKKLYGT